MSTEFTKTVRGDSLLERLSIRSMVVLLKIEGNCSCLRAKGAHMVGHLPPGWADKHDEYLAETYLENHADSK